MGMWNRPEGWPSSAPVPDDPRFPGWVWHVLAVHNPLWLTQAAAEARLGLRETARLSWRRAVLETAVLERALATRDLHQALYEGGLRAEELDEIVDQAVADVEGRRARLRDLAAVGGHLDQPR